MWISLRNPSGKEGRSGRSISRHVKIADSGARPSRRKNEPGILPAAYIRSSMSTVKGKKSAPSRTRRAAVAVTRMVVSPIRATTAPSACPARRPASKDRVLFSAPLTAAETVMASAIIAPLRTTQGPSGPDGASSQLERPRAARPLQLAAGHSLGPLMCFSLVAWATPASQRHNPLSVEGRVRQLCRGTAPRRCP